MVVIWFTGLPCSGKTTLSKMLERELKEKGKEVVLLDGDELRKTISKDLGFSEEDRKEHNRRVIELAKKLSKEGKVVVLALVSPIREVREKAREEIGKEFVEVYLSCPLAVCIERDVKGHYKKALRGEIKNFTGVSQKYEEPTNPEVILYTAVESKEESIKKLMEFLTKRGYV